MFARVGRSCEVTAVVLSAALTFAVSAGCVLALWAALRPLHSRFDGIRNQAVFYFGTAFTTSRDNLLVFVEFILDAEWRVLVIFTD